MATSTSQAAILFLWLLYAATFHLGFCKLRPHCNEMERQALLSFKKGVSDPKSHLSSWSIKKDCCQWAGVQCDNITDTVIGLDLGCLQNGLISKCLNLGGEINLPFSQLEFLNYLDLSGNDFKAIHFCPSNAYYNLSRTMSPHSCGNFSNLLHLDLSHNTNLGMDNLQWISHFPSLRTLDLSGIDLHKESHWIQPLTMLPSLLELSLRGCQLNNVSPGLGWYVNFTSLQTLDLSENHLDSEIFKWVSNLSGDFFALILESSQLKGQIPYTLSNLRNLQYLMLSLNELNGTIPEWFGQYKQLQYLELYGNSLEGSIPPTIGNLSYLVSLELSYNHLNGFIPGSLGKLSNLQNLLLGGNSLVGVASKMNFTKLTNLQMLDLSSANFTFDVDSNWTPPIQLTYVYLHASKLGSTFPAWLYSLESVHYLNISSSGISSVVEDKLWSLAMRTVVLDLSNNLIGGDLSNVLLNSGVIDLRNNNFMGGLPRLSPNVLVLKMANNSFSGSIAPLFCHPMNGNGQLRYLDLSQNLLSGKLPDCFTNWKFLGYVNLGSNNLKGNIPDSVGSLSDLQSLHLSKNQLSGDIPLSLKNCRSLKLLDVGENNISGYIPSWMDQSIRALKLRSNQFNGSLPSEICQLSSLVILDLAHNRLSGSIPRCLHNITSMISTNASVEHEFDIHSAKSSFSTEYSDTLMLLLKGQEASYSNINLNLVHILDLSSNNFSGVIPPELFALTALQSLNLSQNHLVGKIPEEIRGMKLLESLDLSMNQISGRIPESMSILSFLNHLNLSYNNFTGKIPTGTQLQSFDANSYIGNPELCGAPLTKNCTQGENSGSKKQSREEDEPAELSEFYIGMGVGFAAGFWVVCVTLFFNRRCRHAYFKFLDHMKDRLYVFIALKMNSLR